MNFNFLKRAKAEPVAPAKKRSKPRARRSKSLDNLSLGEGFETKVIRGAAGGSDINRLTADFQESVIQGNVNIFIRSHLQNLQRNSRTLAVRTPHGKRAAQYQSDNIVGTDGICPQPRLLDSNGRPNIALNKKIKESFEDWAWRSRKFSLNRKFSWREFQEVLERGRFIDGESLVRIHDRTDGIRVEVLDATRIDINHQFQNEETFCYMGIEYSNDTMEPVRYWIRKIDPLTQNFNGLTEGVDADDIIHYYREYFIGQQRGIPESSAIINTLIQYDGFTNYTLVQKKAAASSMGFITQDKDSQEQIDIMAMESEDEIPQDVVQTLEAGIIQQLPPGMDIKQFTSTQGGDDYYNFTNRLEEQISMGYGFFMQGYRGDTSNINYSSARFGDQAQRVMFKNIQRTMQEKVLERLFERWLQNAILSGEIDIPMTAIGSVLRNTQWSYPKWDSIDPKKDTETEILKIDNGLKPRSDTILEFGQEPETVFAQIQSEKDFYVPKMAHQLEVAKAPAEASATANENA
ncbi:phage portal protein [Pantoea sp. MBLJ3]|uniref:phage portal protein n=1 Tax=Pantoea sp. MBLJ3 TaxID=1562889 RepID=UPI0009E1A96B|nr:phage portal protein [Pantoea sp. MBLJ3]